MSRTRKLIKISHFVLMAARVCMKVFKLCVFTEILLLGGAQKPNIRNVAQSKTCGMSSRSVYRSESSGSCIGAINGNTDTTFSVNLPNCIHTAENDESPFWWVNLGQKFTINTITIYGQQNYIERMTCVNVSLDGDVVKRFTDINGWNKDKYDIRVDRSGQVVNITRDCDKEGYTINICEVQVWVCDDGWYGATCTQPCGHCAGDSVCDKVNGGCTSCQTGFQLPLCKGCVDGLYGINCTQTCGNCYGDSVCDKVNGSCGSCETNFEPPFCKDAIAPDNEKEAVSLVGPVAGASIGCSIVFFIIGLFTGLWLRRSRAQQPSGTLGSPHEISMACDLGTSVLTTRPEPGSTSPDNTSDYSNINVYDKLTVRDDENTALYTFLQIPTDNH